MKKNRFIRTYARLFIDKYKADESAIEGLRAFSELLKQSHSLSSFFKNPMFSILEKERVIHIIAKEAGLSGQVADYIIFLDKQRAIHLVDQVVNVSLLLLQDRRQKAMTEVITAEPIDKNVAAKIRNTIEKVISSDVQIQHSVDSSLIAGFVIKKGSFVYDASIKGQLRMLKETLMKGRI